MEVVVLLVLVPVLVVRVVSVVDVVPVVEVMEVVVSVVLVTWNRASYKSDTMIVFRQGLHPTASIETRKGNDCIPGTGWPSKLTDKMPPLRVSWIV